MAMLGGLLTTSAPAATFYWDGGDADATGNLVDGTNLGGSGTWDTTIANWWDGISTDVVWPSSASDTAVFSGAAGSVILGVPVNVGTVQFGSDGYTLSGSTLTLGGAATIDVAAGSHAGVLSDIAGVAGLTKTGAGTLNLGLLNSYTGNTTILGGVIEVYKDESLGTGGGDISLNGGTLRALGNNFYSTRDITIGAGGGTLDVTRNAYNFGSMRLQGVISGDGTLTKTGFGELRLDGDSSGFTGDFIVDSGIVRFQPSYDRGQLSNLPSLAGASSYTVRSGGDLQLQYYGIGSTPSYSAVNETAPVHMEGGRVTFYSNNSSAVDAWTQNMGDLFLDRGSSRFFIQRSNTGAAAVWSFGDLHRTQTATADFDWSTSSYGTLGAPGVGNPRIVFNSLPAPVNDGILGGWALVNQVDFATYDTTNGVAIASYTSTDITTAGATDNVDHTLAGTTTTIGNTTLNALKLTATASNSTIEQLDGTTLTLDTGGLLAIGNFTKYIQPESGGSATITANGGALYFHNAQSNLYIYSNITDGDMPTAVVKTQTGSLMIYSATDNTYTGGTYINGASNVYTGSTANVAYLGSGPVHVTRGILNLGRQGATTSTAGYSVFEGGSIFLNTSSVAFDTTGDRFTIDGNSSIGGYSTTNRGLNSLTYVAGAVSAGGEAHLDPGATVVHSSNSSAMGTGVNTIQNLPTDMQFYFSPGATTTAASGVTIGTGTPWKGFGTDRNTRTWDLGTVTVNGSDFEMHGMLVPNQNGEGQSAYTLNWGNTTTAGGPVIVGAVAGPLNAHVTGGITRLDDDSSVFGDTSTGSPLTFLVEPGGTLELSQSTAMGSGTGIASIQVLDGGTLQQYGSTDATRLANAASAINGDVTVQARGRFLAQNTNGLTGTGTLTFEDRSIIQINNNTGWSGSQVLPSNGLVSGQNNAIVRLYVDGFGTATEPTLTTYFDGTGIYEFANSGPAANPSVAGTPILSLDGGLVISDAFDRSFEATTNGFIELKPGGAGGTFAATSGQYFNIIEDVELHGQTMTIGYADVVDGDPGLGDLRIYKVTSDAAGGMIDVINGAQLRINATDAVQDDISITLQAGAWLDVDNNDTILELIGNGATSRVLGDATLTVTKTGDYDFNASLGDNARLTQAGGGILTIIQNADGVGILTADGAGSVIKIGPGVTLGTGYTLNPTASGVIDLNGLTVDAAAVTGDATGTIELNGGVLEFANTATLTIDSTYAVINGPGTLRTVGTGSVRFNQDPTRMANISQIDIFNGEFRVDGVSGTPDTFLIDVPVINLGDGLATTGATGFRAFPRLFLVNTETTQTATLNVNGGWIVSDLGANDLTIWSGNINFTGAATTNIFDVNDAGTGDQHAVTGVIGGTGGFSKINTGTLRLEANNTISGNIYIQRNGVGGTNIDSTLSRGGIRLTGPDGALSAANSIVISRDGSFYLNNATDVNLDRVGDSTGLTLRGQGRVRLVGNAAATVSETMGALYIDTGSGKINFDLDDATPQPTTLTFATFKRDPGSIAQFQVLDNISGSFGSPLGGQAQLFISDSGLTPGTAVLIGGGGANGSTNKTLVIGAFGGVNNISNHFMTFDSVNTTELRPLVWDGTPVGSEYFLSREGLTDPHQFTRADLGSVDQNVLINFNTAIEGDIGTGLSGSGSDYGWFGKAPIAILENVAMNSLRFGTNTPSNGVNSNEIGSALVLAPGARIYLGDKTADAFIGAITDSGSGMILFGRAIDGTNPGSNQYIAGGYLDFGTREAIIVNESGNSALIRSNIVGSGGLTKAGANPVYLDNSNSYTGITNVAEGALIVRDQNGLGGSPLVKIEGSGQLYLELGTNIHNTTLGSTPPDLFVGTLDASRVVLYSNNSNNTWDGNVIIDTVDNLGNWVFNARLSVNTRDTLNINGSIYGNEVANPISSDIYLNDARLVSTGGGSSTGGIININGQFSDNVNGPVSAPVTSDNENQLLRFQIAGSNEMIVNVRQQWNAAGQIRVEQGILRYEGDGNFWTPLAAERMDSTNGQSGLRLGGSYNGTNDGTQNVAVILTKPGQVLNIGRIDIGGDGTNNYNAFGNVMLAGTNTSGTVTFGDGTERVFYYGANSSRRFVRDLTLYAAGGGTVELNYRLDDTDGDSHTSFTKIGRGVVNFNGQNDVNGSPQNGDVEQLNMSGGLLRLTNYDNATGRRFDNGAMITLAGGGIEMDGSGAIQNETANYTGAAVVVDPAFPVAQTLISPGGTDVIVTAADFDITMNIGSDSIALTRQSGGTVNFVENATGAGSAVITLEGIGQPANNTAIPWATYGDTYTYNAALASYTLNALDFAMTSNAAGNIELFTAASRQDEDDVTLWTVGNDVSENGAGFSGAASVAVNTIHFDFDGAGAIDATSGLEVTSGGIMVSSSVITGSKMISNGTLTAGADADLIVHQYGGTPMTISSVIADNAGSAAGNALVKTGSGELVLTGANTYTGSTYLNGGQLTISSNTNLGATPGAADADNIYANGGILRVLSDVVLDVNRGMTLGGNGVEISVGPAATLTFNGVIASEPNVIVGYTANPAVGRIDKTGVGTLLLTGEDNTFNGLFDISSGTVKWEPLTALTSGTFAPFGSNNAFLDSTTIRSGATLAIHPLTASTGSNQNFTINEWFTFEGGSTLDVAPVSNATTPHDFNLNLRGVLKFDSLGNPGTPDGFVTPTSLAGATVIDVGRRQINLNDDGGYITGDGGITKTGDSTLAFRENSPEWTGQLVILEGSVYVYGAGNVLGTGSLPIILGHNLLAEQAGEVVSGNTQVQLLFTDEGGYRDVSTIAQDIIVRADDGAGSQTKRIGARFLANIDEVNYDGTITLRDDLEFFYQDDARDSGNTTSSTHVTNNTRSIGTLTNQETVFINFNGNIIGAAGNDIFTTVNQSGTNGAVNGSIDAVGDDLVIRAIFGLNGDNSGWAGNLTIGNTATGGDVDTQHIVTIGNPLALSASNNVTIRSDATLRTNGNDVVIGSLTAANANVNNFIENSSVTSPGSITITQTTDASVDIVLRDGETVFILQPGESYQALSFKKAGPAVLELTKGNSYTGTTTLAGGTLRLAYDADNSMLSDTADLILNDGILDLAGSVAHSEVVGGTIINGTVAIERSTGSSTINLNAITRNAGSLRISADNIATTDNTNVNGILGGWATVGGSWATNSTNGADGEIIGLTTFTNVDRLGGVIANNAASNVRIIEAGASGPVTLGVSGGTTNIYTLLQSATGGTATVDIGAGNTLRVGSGGVLLPDGSSSLAFTNGTLTVGAADDAAGTLFLQSQSTAAATLTVGSVIADNGLGMVGVRTAGPGTTIFTGANTYTGATLVGSGILALGDGGSTGTLGSEDVNIEASGILAFNRSDAGLSVTNQLTGTGNVAQNGTGTTTLAAAPAAITQLNFVAVNGTLATGVDNAINTTGNLTFGDTHGATTTATVDLTNGSATVGGLLVQTDTTTANQIIIGAGKTLAVNGDVTIGVDIANSTDTALTVSGGGTLSVTKDSGTFQIGGATGSVNGNRAVVDMSDLDFLTVDLGIGGVFRVGDKNANSSSSGNAVTVATLADTTTITAGTLGVGDSQGISNAVATLNLGSVATVLNLDSLNIGDRLGQRGQGVLQFATGTGTLQVRGADGASRTNMNIISSGAGTGLSMTATVDLTGHASDLFLNSLVMGLRTSGNGGATSAFSFDTGTLDVNSVILGNKLGGSGTNTIRGTLNIGGGTVVIGVGGISMGLNSAGNTASTAAGAVNLTGGTVSVDGDIVHGGTTGGARISSAALTLDGASLDMQGHNIGDATNLIDNTFASGSLANVAEINGGGGLTKTTTGLLILDGVNTYTGATTVDAGILQFARQTAFYNNTPASWTAANLVVNSGATAAFNVGDAGEFTSADIDLIKDLGTGVGGFLDGSIIGIDTTNATGTFTCNTVIADTNAGANSLGLNKLGTGTLELTAANTYTGKTVVSGGTLSVAGVENLGTTPGSFVADQLTLNGGILQFTGTTVIEANRGITVDTPGGGTLETAVGTTTINSVITGGGSFTKTGDGTVLIMGTNTNTGTTHVNAGTLGGTGKVGGNLTVNSGGTVAPGVADEGLLTIGGNLSVSSGGTLLMQLGGATLNDEATIRANNADISSIGPGTIAGWENTNTVSLHDHIFSNDGSAPVINGTLKIDSTFLNGYTPVYGDIFDLLDWTTLSNSITGTPSFDFSGVVLGGDLVFNTQLFASNGIIVVVPEPSRALLVMLGLAGLLLRRRRC